MKERLNITIVNRMMLTHFGGGENFDLNIAKRLRERGHNVRILTGKTFFKRSSSPEDIYSFPVIEVPFLYIS